jgi:5-methyltetrahydropteroyltriglutamate--homocysteine methyltransferase
VKRSADRILTTHVGSLVRPTVLREFLAAKEAGKPYDAQAYADCLAQSVAEIVRRQADAGIDIISDGEFGKAISWSQYMLYRLSGFERRPFKGDLNSSRACAHTRPPTRKAEGDGATATRQRTDA